MAKPLPISELAGKIIKKITEKNISNIKLVDNYVEEAIKEGDVYSYRLLIEKGYEISHDDVLRVSKSMKKDIEDISLYIIEHYKYKIASSVLEDICTLSKWYLIDVLLEKKVKITKTAFNEALKTCIDSSEKEGIDVCWKFIQNGFKDFDDGLFFTAMRAEDIKLLDYIYENGSKSLSRRNLKDIFIYQKFRVLDYFFQKFPHHFNEDTIMLAAESFRPRIVTHLIILGCDFSREKLIQFYRNKTSHSIEMLSFLENL